MPLTGNAKRAYDVAWKARRRHEWIKANGPCTQCGSDDRPQVDHVDPATKAMNPTRLWSMSAEKRSAELAKCQVLCYSCHLEKTRREQSFIPPHGTKARYSRKDEHRCRCIECRRAAADYARNRRALLRMAA